MSSKLTMKFNEFVPARPAQAVMDGLWLTASVPEYDGQVLGPNYDRNAKTRERSRFKAGHIVDGVATALGWDSGALRDYGSLQARLDGDLRRGDSDRRTWARRVLDHSRCIFTQEHPMFAQIAEEVRSDITQYGLARGFSGAEVIADAHIADVVRFVCTYQFNKDRCRRKKVNARKAKGRVQDTGEQTTCPPRGGVGGDDETVVVSSRSAPKLRQLTLAPDAAMGNCNEVDDGMSEADAPGHAVQTVHDEMMSEADAPKHAARLRHRRRLAAHDAAAQQAQKKSLLLELKFTPGQVAEYLQALAAAGYDLVVDLEGASAEQLVEEAGLQKGHAERIARHFSEANRAKTQKGERAPHYLTVACSVLVDGMNVVGSSAPTASDFQRLLALLETFNGKFRLPDSGVSGMHAVAILPSWTRRCWGVTGDDVGVWARQLELWGWAYFVDTTRDRSSDDKALISFSRRYALPVVTNDGLGDHVLRARREGDREVFEGTLLVLESRIAHAGTRIVGGLDAEVTRALGYRPPAATRHITPRYPPLPKWRDDRAMIAEAWRADRGFYAVARWLRLMGLLDDRGRPDHPKIVALRERDRGRD
jgi:hypothetical protein